MKVNELRWEGPGHVRSMAVTDGARPCPARGPRAPVCITRRFGVRFGMVNCDEARRPVTPPSRLYVWR